MPANVKRIFLPPRYSRGNTNVTKIQPIDYAAWVWHPALVDELPGLKPRAVRFSNSFEATGGKLIFHISADERFVLILDGEIISRGPNRGTVENWQYHSYEAELSAGPHIFEVVCWTIGEAAPLAQRSFRGGFIFKAEGDYDALLSTGTGKWKVGIVPGTETMPPTPGSGAWGTGCTFLVRGNDVLHAEATDWKDPAVVRTPVINNPDTLHCGCRSRGWMLFPTQLPDQIERKIRPGEFKAVTGAHAESPYFYAAEDASNPLIANFNRLLRDGEELIVPPNTVCRALWDLGDYYGAYPVIETEGGEGSSVKLIFHESLYAEDGIKHHRDEFIGKHLFGYGDTFIPDGGRGHFTSLWWRTGRWAEIEITTTEKPVTLRELSLIESRYPLERESSFENGDATLSGVQKICLRGMQMCCHEMLFDCPFYEQQMYPGDTRVQLLVLTALSRDERMIRRAIEIYDLAARDDGMVPFNYPTRGLQEGGSYTLCWLLMFGDYVMWHDNREWLRARVPGMRHTLSGLAYYEDADGILRNLPGWNFLDWVDENPFDTGSWAPGSLDGDKKRGSIMSLFWVLALQSAAKVERALGDEAMARYWEEKARRTAESVIRIFWSEERGLIADTDAFDHYSEHAQSLAILTGLLPADKAARVAQGLIEAPDLARATVYFSYYLFEAYFKIGRGDLFEKRLDLWRGYVREGLRTPLEMPGDKARSDCHAWGSHPIFWLQSGVAGVTPSSAFFRTVRIAPQPGTMKEIRTKVPHPDGFITVDLSFSNGIASGRIELPAGITGEFVYGGRRLELAAGANAI